MTRKDDISAPQGYFENLRQRLGEIPTMEQKPTTFQKVSPWLAYAASLVILAGIANFIFRPSAGGTSDEYDWDYVSYLTGSMDPDGVVELREADTLSEDDIVNYLLADNVSVEQLMYSSYEEDF